LVVIGLASLYDQFARSFLLASALEGCAGAAAGLLIGMGLQLSGRVVANSLRSGPQFARSVAALAIVVTVFVAIAMLHLPTVPTVLCATPLSVALFLFFGTSRGKTE
jgi:chromate transporter